jgi:hypothetical protein
MRKDIIILVANSNDNVLLLRRQTNKRFEPGKWELSSSLAQENNKPLEQQAKDNLMFDVGLHGTLLRKGREYSVTIQDEDWTVHPFLFSCPQSVAAIRKTDHSECKWIPISDLEKYPLVEGLKKNLVCVGLLRSV